MSWVLETRPLAEKIAETIRLGGCISTFDPEAFATREAACLALLLHLTRTLERELEEAAGLHEAAPDNAVVVPFRQRPPVLTRELRALEPSPPVA